MTAASTPCIDFVGAPITAGCELAYVTDEGGPCLGRYRVDKVERNSGPTAHYEPWLVHAWRLDKKYGKAQKVSVLRNPRNAVVIVGAT